MTKRLKFRDAITGQYVADEYAEANPATTVGEKPSERVSIVNWLRAHGYPEAAGQIEVGVDQEQT